MYPAHGVFIKDIFSVMGVTETIYCIFSGAVSGGRIVPRFQELTPEKLGKVQLHAFLYLVLRNMPWLRIMYITFMLHLEHITLKQEVAHS
jgi:hypothetical protein